MVGLFEDSAALELCLNVVNEPLVVAVVTLVFDKLYAHDTVNSLK